MTMILQAIKKMKDLNFSKKIFIVWLVLKQNLENLRKTFLKFVFLHSWS